MYNDSCSALVAKYNFLRDHTGKGYESWHQMIKNKFKKERRPLVFIPEIQQKKTSSKTPPETTSTAIMTVDGTSTLGEDAISLGCHREKMQAECHKKHPNLSILQDKMARTRVERTVYLENHSTMETLDEYPALRFPIVLLAETNHQLDVDVDRSIMSGMGIVARKIIEECQRRATGRDLFKMYDDAKDAFAEESHRGLQLILATFLLPHLFREDPNAIYLINKDPEVPTPVLIITGNPFLEATFGVRLDYTDILTHKVDDITLWLATLMSIYFVFNIEYHKKVKNTLSFIEKYLMSNTPEGKISPTVIKMANYLFS
ncbi:sterile alpha motif domain-containing protein 3-like isoform X2 [Alosa alosa]|nr:sterile alpha motif domain-containing protein 3-like isoform X2 [Alosa alosa]XP_048119849.1 sterile alpha motif domain-containing protein 3-like isoform X2 [Alosa alosa]XP_048119850.1 sterile alpha motif domain-containing protein 3-like isoform X2 [Alosa alosa]XP_048119851.1 sterile alpha motif domain-containing protein 3-like isoform X2 [Alosa alosa]